MQKSELQFDYPDHLIATERKAHSRVMLCSGGEPIEVTPAYILTQIQPEDLLVINESKVIKARVHSAEGLEILFVQGGADNHWQVLCPARRWDKSKALKLPGGVEMFWVKGGRPQEVRLSEAIDHSYFEKWGELPLPPYIQEARGERKTRSADSEQYQTAWANELGSLAAPTASLHFTQEDLSKVRARGADVSKLCLHVGLGTFLPISSENLNEHEMHHETVSLSKETWQSVLDCKKRGGKVWALGSTVTRALESQALGIFQEDKSGFLGDTSLFIQPGFEFQIVDVLMTNFHQPETTLVAMVMAFAGKEKVIKNYQWAIERNFRLFSYGDLSVWMK